MALLVTFACAGAPSGTSVEPPARPPVQPLPAPAPPAQRPPDPQSFPHGRALFDLLVQSPGIQQRDSLEALEERLVLDLTDTLATIADQPSVHPLLRANALLLAGRRAVPRHFIMLRPLLQEDDERIRLAVVAAARAYLPTRPEASMQLLGEALADSSPNVQARVLEAASDRDVEMLRAYVARSPAHELAIVARDLIAAAEERGAPLEADSGGVLRRTGPGGHTLTYRPRRSWPSWQLSIGTLALTPADGSPVMLGDSIEAARSVVPAFFSNDGRWLVYERSREIRVRSVETGAERVLGPGLAPRPLPFTNDFIFVRELPDARTQLRTGSRLQYELHRAPFQPQAGTSVDAEVVGLVGGNVRFEVSGAASPVRWMRVRERWDGSGFELVGDGIDAVVLPGPATGDASESR